MKTYEQIAVCYRMAHYYHCSCEYYKKALFYAYYINDHTAELHYYERLAVCYMDLGLPNMMNNYYERFNEELVDPKNGICRQYAVTQISSKIKRLDIEINQSEAQKKALGIKLKYRGPLQHLRKGLN
jgi:hypothetical protein